jgi:hypothetical protein
MSKVDPAIEGQGGDEHTFKVACRLVRGFGLTDSDALDLMRDWNQTCVPPWTDRELQAKVAAAVKYGAEPFGGLASAPPPPSIIDRIPGSHMTTEPHTAATPEPEARLPGLVGICAALDAFRYRLERGDVDRMPFGIGRLDRATRGIEPGELAIVLGRTASLKTMWLLNWIRLLVRQRPDAAFLIVEMEMPFEQLSRRLLRMDYNRTDEQLDTDIKSGVINLDRFADTYRNLHFLDKGAVSLTAIERYAVDLSRVLGEETRLEGIFIDHAGLLRSEHGGGSSYERASAAAIGLKQMARSLSVAVFCVVQANRGGNKTDGEPVNLEAARDSGCYEENADFVLAFGNITEPPNEQPFVRMRLAKNRRGPSVPVMVGFDPHSLKMAERVEADSSRVYE